MPTYTYTCTSCNDVVEKRQSFHDAPLTTCEQCGGSLRKVFHPVGIVFKGSGWYVTDSRSTSSTTATNGTPGAKKTEPSSSSDSGSDSGSSSASTSTESSSSTPAPSTPATSTPSKD